MPVKIPQDLPAVGILEKENVFVMTENRALTQDIRPLKIAVINLMPTREKTETQILRMLGNTPLQIEVKFIKMMNHAYKNTNLAYLDRFYIPSSELSKRKFDGMIVTGAPIEQLEFEEVDYWKELCEIMDYAKKNVFSTIYLCWASFAALYHHYGIEKHATREKLFGIFMNYKTSYNDPLLRGLDDQFPIPQSRHTTIDESDVKKHKDELVILAKSIDAGVTLIKSSDNREIYMTGHLEYDTDTLANEYWRDKLKGLSIALPKNYFPNNNTSLPPSSYWRSSSYLFYSNWLNYYVYQEAPYNFA